MGLTTRQTHTEWGTGREREGEMESRYASQPAIHPFRRSVSWPTRESPRSTARFLWPPQIREMHNIPVAFGEKKKKKKSLLFSPLLTTSPPLVLRPALPLDASAGKWACECCESRRNTQSDYVPPWNFKVPCAVAHPPCGVKITITGNILLRSLFSPSDLSNKWLVESVLWLAE